MGDKFKHGMDQQKKHFITSGERKTVSLTNL